MDSCDAHGRSRCIGWEAEKHRDAADPFRSEPFSVQFFLLHGDRVSIVPVLWNPNSTTSQVKSRLHKMPQAWINAKGLLFVA